LFVTQSRHFYRRVPHPPLEASFVVGAIGTMVFVLTLEGRH
jgi:hypothetical protein